MSTNPATVAIRSAVRECLSGCSAGDTVLVAVSGGADSLALAAALVPESKNSLVNLVGVTIDHQLQKNSGEQAIKVIAQLSELGIAQVEIVKVNVEMVDGLEASARRARYAALDAAAEKHNAKLVFLGHTLNDQAESVLLGLARGSGARSLSGMARYTGKYRRPLLEITRSETLAACDENKLTPWVDPHNSDSQFARVRVRTDALPKLEESIGPGITKALARSADLLRDDADALDGWATQVAAELDLADLEITTLADLPKAVRTRLLRKAIYAAGAPIGSITADHVACVEAFVTSWHGQGACSLPGGVKVSRISGRLSLLSR
ncbi:MAG: tRNA lysidine(34) synthetase TilS [Actinobacteria bacterium]|nr:tRNA lysidine(34) synthetase TilS [Actinomycetota bacterium]